MRDKLTYRSVYEIGSIGFEEKECVALDEEGYFMEGVSVKDCGEGVYLLRGPDWESYWQVHNDDCSFHSDTLSEMTDFAQGRISKYKVEEIV